MNKFLLYMKFVLIVQFFALNFGAILLAALLTNKISKMKQFIIIFHLYFI